MFRRLQLATEDQFVVLWISFHQAPRPTDRNFDAVKADARIRTQLLEVSRDRTAEDPPHTAGAACPRVLNKPPQSILLIEGDYRLLIDSMEKLAPHWLPAFAPEVVAVYDWIHACEQIDAQQAAKALAKSKP